MGLGDFIPVIGHAIDAVGSVASGLFNSNQAQKNRAFQERMYNQQVKDNRETWQMMVDYDTPLNQKNRLLEAGLNPLLMYGSGGVSNTVSSPAQGGSAPHGAQGSANFQTNFGQALYQSAMMGAQVENLKADSDLKTAQALEAAEETIKKREEAKGKKYENTYYLETWQLRKDAMLAENELKRALEKTEASKQDEMAANIRQADQQVEYIRNEIENKNKLTDQEIKESNQRIENSIKETSAAVAKMDAEAKKAYADAFYATVLANTANDPEYKQAYIQKMANEAREALLRGDAQEIENGLNQWLLKMRPEAGSNAYQYRKFLDNWVSPLTESIGKIFGGSASYSIGGKKK